VCTIHPGVATSPREYKHGDACFRMIVHVALVGANFFFFFCINLQPRKKQSTTNYAPFALDTGPGSLTDILRPSWSSAPGYRLRLAAILITKKPSTYGGLARHLVVPSLMGYPSRGIPSAETFTLFSSLSLSLFSLTSNLRHPATVPCQGRTCTWDCSSTLNPQSCTLIPQP